MQITLRGLPKISLNTWYASEHWSARKKIKDSYIWIIKSQFKNVIPIGQYEVEYDFTFKSKPLDASNCIAMTKMCEDIIFQDDKWDIIQKLSITSKKGIEDLLIITIHDKNHTL